MHRLAELRKRQHTTQVQVAEAMGVTQARVSRIEKGQLERSEVDTLACVTVPSPWLNWADAAVAVVSVQLIAPQGPLRGQKDRNTSTSTTWD
ncbi:helix-turn-helix domain-containing protein [Streptomyces sp. NPDC001617]